MFEKDGSGGFTEVDEFPAPSYLSCAIMLDFDEDGDIDLALTDEIADVVVLHPNLGIDLPEPTPACAPTPEPCRTPTASGKSQLQIKNTAPDDKDRLEWKWKAGAAITLGEYGDISLVGYDLCLYDDGAFVTGQTVPAGGNNCRKARDQTKSFDYKDKELTPDGIEKLQLKAGVAGKASIQVKGRGLDLGLPPLTPPLVRSPCSFAAATAASASAPRSARRSQRTTGRRSRQSRLRFICLHNRWKESSMRRTFVTVTLLSLVLAPLGATASATDEETFQKLMNKVAPKSTDLINKFKPRNACACMSDVPPSPGIVVQDNSGDVRCGKLGFNVDGSVGSIIFCNDFEVLGR